MYAIGVLCNCIIDQKQKQKELDAMQKIENERNRISRDLHDNVGSLVSFVNTKVDWIIKNRNIDENLKNDLSLVKNNSKEILFYELHNNDMKITNFFIIILFRFILTASLI